MKRFVLPLAIAAFATLSCTKQPPPASSPVEKASLPQNRTVATTPPEDSKSTGVANTPEPDPAKAHRIAPDAVNLDRLSEPLIVRDKKSVPTPANPTPKPQE